MESQMAVSREKIKALRESRAWSQAHLAEAASLSLRTVQRVEAEGTASAETRLAIAAALSVSVDELNVPAPVPEIEPDSSTDRVFPGPLELLLMFATLGVTLVYVLWMGSQLPPQVASHFGVTGDVNGHMSRDGFVATMMLEMLGLPLLIWTLLGWAVRRGKLKIPHASYWLSAPRRAATVRFMYRHVTWLNIGVTLFLGYAFWMVAAANAGAPAHPTLDMKMIYVGLATFLALVAGWVVLLSLRFRRDGA